MHASAHVALLLAALGDADGARRRVDLVREVPGGVRLGYWTRPTPDAVAGVARGELHAFELALLDREICVPLLLLEAFARRGWERGAD